MPDDIIKRIEYFLTDYFDSDRARRRYVENALRDCGNALKGIDYAGNPADFTHHVVQHLDTFGTCDDDRWALVHLLETVAKDKGQSVKQEAQQLIRELEQKPQPIRLIDPLAAGDTVCDCTLIELLGKGGNGEVWLARQPIFDANDYREVAVKRLLPKWANSKGRIQRFKQEPIMQMKLEDVSHVTTIYGVCLHDGLPAIVSQYVAGKSLESYVKGRAIDPYVVVKWLKQIALALDAAHRLDPPLYHRDVKPENILVKYNTDGLPEHLYLADFGLVFSENQSGTSRQSSSNEKVGTREYIAPEQFASEFRHHGISPMTDVYALAIMAYELLTGELPFTGDDDQILYAHRTQELPDNDHPLFVDKPFVLDVLRRGAAKNPADRPASATAFVTRLADALDGKAPEAVEHYLSVTLVGHIEEVLPEGTFAALEAAYESLSGHAARQQNPEKPVKRTKSELVGKGGGLGLGKKSKRNKQSPPLLEPAGAVYMPREHVEYGEPEYTDDIRMRVRKLKRVVLLGAPGSGKTFTLARLALDYTEDYRTSPSHPIPLFVPLSKYDTDEDFKVFVKRYLGELNYTGLNVIWLLDALNEMPDDKKQRDKLKAFIQELTQANIPFIVTCRVRDYDAELKDVPDLYRVDLQDLNPQQIHNILSYYIVADKDREAIWGEVMYGVHEGTNLLSAWAAWGDSVNTFWQRPRGTWNSDRIKRTHLEVRNHVHTDPRKLMLLCRSPFTLGRLLIPTFIEAIDEADENNQDFLAELKEQLPDNRAELFGAVIDRMLESEGERENNQWTETDHERIKAALEFTAAALQDTQQRTEMPLDDLFKRDDAPHDLHERLKMGRDAMLITLTDSGVRFNHQLYQEYFATSRLRDLLEDYDRRHPNWQSGAPLPPRDERLAELFPKWWDVGGWRVTVALLGELMGRTEIGKVVRWLASYAPEIALNMILDNNDGITVADLTTEAQQALIDGGWRRSDEPNPVGRAAAYRVLGHPDVDGDHRDGVGVDDNGLPDMVWCELEAGEYTIGGDDKAWEPLPKTTFTVPEGVYVAQYLVTYRQFEAFVQSPEFKNTQDPCWQDIPENQRGQACIDDQDNKHWNHPRENVSWYGAVAYSRWLTAKYRDAGIIRADQMLTLPHEYLWEAAARGKTRKFYPYGNELNANKANIDNTGIGQTSAVGIFPEGRADCGALDMQGNVLEWALNPHGDVNSIDVANSAARSLRGAAFVNDDTDFLRAAARSNLNPYDRYDNRGCRLFLVPINKALSSGALDSVLW